MSAISVSVIIPTYCRKNYLLDVLNCLIKQSVLPKEVFIIDSSPESGRLGREDVDRLPPWINYETCENIKNIPWKKNLAIPRCTGEILLFLDDDILFDESLIADHLECYAETDADGISGLVLLPGEEKSDKPVVNNEGWLWNVGLNVRNLNKVIDTKVICTANFSIRRDVLLSVGGFDERIKGTWDDTELGFRLINYGYKIIHHPKPGVLHLKPNSGGSREEGVDIKFALANVLYFHLKHSRNRFPFLLYIAAFWKYCRPGRRWLKPRFMIKRCEFVFSAIMDAKHRVIAGPIYLNFTENDR